MARFSLILPDGLLADLRVEAKRQNISVNRLVRGALNEYLRWIRSRKGTMVTLNLHKVDLNQPVVDWTPEEQKFADEVMRIFREEDR